MSRPLDSWCTPVGSRLLRDLLIVSDFIDEGRCERLVELHQRFCNLTPSSDNGFYLPNARSSDPATFELAREVLLNLCAMIAGHFREKAHPDLAIVCGITANGFRHTLHADNAKAACPRHGSDAEELVRIGCNCPNLAVQPNHTPWRKYSALLYLSDQHTGGDIVFGAGPGRFGRSFRKTLHPKAGLLVLFPSNELYFHHTTPVTSGVRYSMNAWFVTDAARASADWA